MASTSAISLGQFCKWGLVNPDLVELIGDGKPVDQAASERIAKLAEVPAVTDPEAAALRWHLLGMLQVRPEGLRPDTPSRTAAWLDKAFDLAKRVLK